MKKKQSIVFVVEPQDVLTEQLVSIKGGNTSTASIECNPRGIIECRPKGTIKKVESISVWS